MSTTSQQSAVNDSSRRNTFAYRAALFALIAIACLLTTSTYSVFGHTWDEPEHIAAGMRLLDTGKYPYDVQHPPVARVAMAIGPYLAGAHSYGNPGPSGEQEGRDILYRAHHYDLYLTLARVGMLPFLIVLVFSTWLWARRSYGEPTALLAAAFVVVTPVIIGHAAVAALDVPMAAATMLALYLLMRWFDDLTYRDVENGGAGGNNPRPKLSRAVAFGVAAGIAAGTKLSAIPFVGCVATVWFIAATLAPSSFPRRRESTLYSSPELDSRLRGNDGETIFAGSFHVTRSTLGHIGVMAVTALLALIFCYGFGFAQLSSNWPIPIPVGIPRLIASLTALLAHNDGGHLSFFMGELRRSGWWNFYLIALAVKTPLPLLLCSLAGSVWLAWRSYRERDWFIAAPVLAGVAILLFCSAYSRINIGVRHVMILFPLMAIVAAAFVVAMWNQFHHGAVRVLLVLLLGWQTWSMANAHPDYLAYFNELAGSHPEKILVDSDLDWGQDMRRLENELHARHITEFSLIYRGTADLPHENLPHYKRLWPQDRATGWIAVSLLAKATAEDDGRYSWLDVYQPVMRVGKSIDLYYIAPDKNSENRDTGRETRQN